MIIFTDRCLDQIGKGIAAHEPEVGGALLKLPDSNVICEFVADPMAQTTGASYVPSKELTNNVRAAEHKYGLQFAGIIHSHPSNIMQPSNQDKRAFSLSLALNPRLAAFIAPIVTISKTERELQENQCLLNPRGLMTLYVAYRKRRQCSFTHHTSYLFHWGRHATPLAGERSSDPRNDGVELYEPPVGVLYIEEDIGILRKYLGNCFQWLTHDITYTNVNGVSFISAALRFENVEIVLLFSAGYPFMAPIVLLTPIWGGVIGDTEQVQFDWPISTQEDRLSRLVNAIVGHCKRINLIKNRQDVSKYNINHKSKGSDLKVLDEPKNKGAIK